MKVIGIIGDGQLAKMTIQAAKKYNVKILTMGKNTEEKSLCLDNMTVKGDYKDEKVLRFFSKCCDVLSYEIEEVGIECIENEEIPIFPQPRVLKILRDKLEQHKFYLKNDIPVPQGVSSEEIKPEHFIEDYCQDKTKFVVKYRRGGYNGKGVLITNKEDLLPEYKDCLFQEYIDCEKEIGVIVCRDIYRNIMCYRPVDMFFNEENILSRYHFGHLDKNIEVVAKNLAMKIVERLDGVGVFGIEFFLTKEGKLLVNETSPRLHNCGHHTMDFCQTSQFDQYIKILCGEKIDIFEDTSYGTLVNILYPFREESKISFDCEKFKRENEETLNMYGKEIGTYMRKIGHYTSKNIYHIPINIKPYFQKPLIGVIMGSESDMEVMKNCLSYLNDKNISYECKIVSAHRTPHKMIEYGSSASDRGLKVIIAAAGGAAHLPGMIAACTVLPVIGVPIMTKTMNGLDSLYSIVQMPEGVPVATVSINGAKNAGILACQILGLYSENEKKDLISKVDQMNKNIECL